MKKDQKSTYCEHCGDFHDAPPGEFASSVRVGELVPDFEFAATHKGTQKAIKLSDFRGKWLVIAFYPSDFNTISGRELGELAELQPRFKKLGAEILALSTDTVLSHDAWRAADAAIGKLPFTLGSDPSGKICYAFGTLIEDEGADLADEEGLSLRATFIVDPHGILRSEEVLDTSVQRSAAETLRKLEALVK